MTDELFADLPVQHAPASIETDAHILERCNHCTGAGRIYRHQDGRSRQVTCRHCTGAGKIFRPIGAMKTA
jgi:DnaJ-class molecular chaperone